jgi:membrane protein DedA with SNARE-associated domain
MDLKPLILAYGYPAVVAGSFFEGETVVLAAGLMAQRGYLHLPWVLLAAFAGAMAGDQFFFHLGRRGGTALLERRPLWRRNADRIRMQLERHRVLAVIGFRFVYGLRIVTPVIAGMSGFGARAFLALNALGAALWAAAVGGAGYAFGRVLETLLADLRRWEHVILLGVLLAGAGLAAGRAWRRRRVRRFGIDTPPPAV